MYLFKISKCIMKPTDYESVIHISAANRAQVRFLIETVKQASLLLKDLELGKSISP